MLVGVAALAFAVIYPIGLGLFACRKLNVPWRHFWFGAAAFLLFQLLAQSPTSAALRLIVLLQIRDSSTLLWAWSLVLILGAGAIAEIVRYFSYRVVMRSERKTWPKAVMFGIGYAGIETMFLSAMLGVMALIGPGPALDERFMPLPQQPDFGTPLLLMLWERLWAVPVQVALSVIVPQAFTQGSLRWLGLAVGAHVAFDLVPVGLTRLANMASPGTLVVEVSLAAWGLLAAWLIWRLRPAPTGPPVEATLASR